MTNLKDNIFIEGFNSALKRDDKILDFLEKGHVENGKWVIDELDKAEILFSGKTSEISEAMATKYVEKHPNIHFRDYSVPSHIKIKDWTSNWTKTTAKESIQSACNKPYCIIYKK